jgi:hypothetical protein
LVAYRHGLRASELVALRWDDIDLALVEIGLFIAVLLFGYYWVAREDARHSSKAAQSVGLCHEGAEEILPAP